jgi:hypothetical protein
MAIRVKAAAAPCCAGCAGGALAGLGALEEGQRGRALRQLGRAHQARALGGGLGDIDMSSFVVSQSGLDQETAAFDGRLNSWLLDYAAAAAALPPSFVAQVDDFVSRWRAQKDQFYWFQTTRLGDIVRSEGEFNRLRAQYQTYGQTTAIGPATVQADGKTVPADQIPSSADWLAKAEGALKWAGLLVGGVALLKITSDLGVWKKLGRLGGGAPP